MLFSHLLMSIKKDTILEFIFKVLKIDFVNNMTTRFNFDIWFMLSEYWDMNEFLMSNNDFMILFSQLVI